ncbi:tRNA (adenosine(37)-N6)-threonylcarbamoyltransferase complex transferase subunit TsaD [Helicobacter monodelphidis]|uniref:tRNA (adenosine(37)-N6)-threonylcarbamoyltransferase complex transferase subunit TsaD n=1 Tax=Helicobacter sp. 15-1451 TaxID=2004995 RepID=UPI000DCC83EC|nr:tRNA (adenosine(37)-N6)-threonylcarbamoyltransferase complex transferase subunit TsaD [Helicobacter sp. 15-1451]RAX58961.1 tRNA (adenosine(37)-N6)-threonylcarbamoyltransferase complex transferase subunit TsaD [Helicobacter sp. 15-1451]
MLLSIESSCDDSSIAITDIASKNLVFHQKISQDSEHTPYGGVVPEIASRLHATQLPLILEKTKPFLKQVKAVAVTYTPGLSVTLLEGVTMAKALCLMLNIPLIGVHHLKGHIYSLFIEKEAIFPLDVLLVSGGHTLLLKAKNFAEMDICAKSLDDSFGESFDKVAKMLNLTYPGGPIVESYAQKGNPMRFAFTIPLSHYKDVAFSFSGLKNSVRLAIEELKQQKNELSLQDKYDICASFQKTAIAHLVQQCGKFLQYSKNLNFAVVGGASANLCLREALQELLGQNRHLYFAPLEFCSDNAAMIGRVGVEAYLNGVFSDLDLQVIPRTSEIL